jgi:hypothetical protein
MDEYTEGVIAALLLIVPTLIALVAIPKKGVDSWALITVLVITIISFYVVGCLVFECIGPTCDYWRNEKEKGKRDKNEA